MANKRIVINVGKISTLAMALAEKHAVRVGLFGAKKSIRKEGILTNPELGAIHEFGSKQRSIPARSFLRMPIATNGDEIAKNAGDGMAQLMTEGQVLTFFKRLGIAAEAVVLKAFETAGFGQWAPNAPSTVSRKGSSSPLIDTGQLRRAVASVVV